MFNYEEVEFRNRLAAQKSNCIRSTSGGASRKKEMLCFSNLQDELLLLLRIVKRVIISLPFSRSPSVRDGRRSITSSDQLLFHPPPVEQHSKPAELGEESGNSAQTNLRTIYSSKTSNLLRSITTADSWDSFQQLQLPTSYLNNTPGEVVNTKLTCVLFASLQIPVSELLLPPKVS